MPVTPRHRPSGSARGTAIIELAIIVYLLFMLLAGLADVSFLCREQIVVSEAVRSSLRTIVVAQPMPKVINTSSYSYFPSDEQKCTYVTERYNRAITLSQYLLSENRLNPANYDYRVSNSTRQIQGRKYKFVNYRIQAKAGADRLFLFFNEAVFGPSLAAASIIEGVPADDAFDNFVDENEVSSGCD